MWQGSLTPALGDQTRVGSLWVPGRPGLSTELEDSYWHTKENKNRICGSELSMCFPWWSHAQGPEFHPATRVRRCGLGIRSGVEMKEINDKTSQQDLYKCIRCELSRPHECWLSRQKEVAEADEHWITCTKYPRGLTGLRVSSIQSGYIISVLD